MERMKPLLGKISEQWKGRPDLGKIKIRNAFITEIWVTDNTSIKIA
jgi:hypothetical protein